MGVKAPLVLTSKSIPPSVKAAIRKGMPKRLAQTVGKKPTTMVRV